MKPTRREMLRIGGFWGSTLALSELFRARAGGDPLNESRQRESRASCAVCDDRTRASAGDGSPWRFPAVAATLYHVLGVPANTIIHEPLRRSHSLVF